MLTQQKLSQVMTPTEEAFWDGVHWLHWAFTNQNPDMATTAFAEELWRVYQDCCRMLADYGAKHPEANIRTVEDVHKRLKDIVMNVCVN